MANQTTTSPIQPTSTPVATNPLDNIRGKYRVVPCKKTWLHGIDPHHDGAVLFGSAQIWIVAERHYSTPDVMITGLTEEEQLAFEQKMQLPIGTLSPFNKEYWGRKETAIKIPKDGLNLDCDSNIKHKLFYKMLLVNSRVARSKEDIAFGDYDVYISSEAVEAKVESQTYLSKGRAYAKFGTMTQSDKINYLKVYNEGMYKVNSNTSPELVDQTIGRILEQNPDQFLQSFENSFYKEYILLEDLLSKNIIVKKGGRYFINGGLEIGVTKAQVVANLSSQDYEDTRVQLIAKLDAQK